MIDENLFFLGELEGGRREKGLIGQIWQSFPIKNGKK